MREDSRIARNKHLSWWRTKILGIALELLEFYKLTSDKRDLTARLNNSERRETSHEARNKHLVEPDEGKCEVFSLIRR